MTDLWSFRIEVDESDLDLTGYDVEATDGHIGKIDESSLEVGDSYLVVDTGFWIFGKKRVIPAQAVKQINTTQRIVFIDMTKDQVEGAPDHHPDWAQPDLREPLMGYYGPMTWS